jgi:hypothetical protein
MPVTEPATSERNLTPSTVAFLSFPSRIAGVAKSKIDACGVTAFVAPDAGPVADPFVAFTVNVYGVPTVSPLTRVERTAAPTCTGVSAVAPSNGVTV